MKRLITHLGFLALLLTSTLCADDLIIPWRGGVYSGQISDGVPNNEGTWRVPNVGVYVGGFKHGALHGFGMQEYVDGTRYAEEYKANSRTGQGWFMFGSGVFKGVSFIGEFKEDKFWNGKEFDRSFSQSATYLDGLRQSD